MTKDVILWAQALDNVSPDHIAVNGQTLGAADPKSRQNAVSAVSQVSLSSLTTVNCGDVRLSVSKDRFVVEVPSTERDEVGRIALVICCGSYQLKDLDRSGEAVVRDITKFAQHIGRTLAPDQLECVRRAFSEIESGIRRREFRVKLAAGAFAAVALLALARCLSDRNSQRISEEQAHQFQHQAESM